MKTILLLAGCLCCMAACDPGFGVHLTNNSPADVRVQVIETRKEIFARLIPLMAAGNQGPYRDTVWSTIDSTGSGFVFGFVLKQGLGAILQRGIGGPNMQQKIVINEADTINLMTDKRVKRKRRWVSTFVSITVQ
jgi:hypothetical protein